jgi:hypothetical protein
MSDLHCNTQEGIWAGVRIYLRLFRGVSKWYLAQYEAIFQWTTTSRASRMNSCKSFWESSRARIWPHVPSTELT